MPCPFRKLYPDILIVQPAQDEDETMLRANSNHTPDERHGDFAPPARIEGVIEGLREGVDLIVVAAGGKGQEFLAEFVEPRRPLGKKTDPASIRAVCAFMRITLSSFGSTAIAWILSRFRS